MHSATMLRPSPNPTPCLASEPGLATETRRADRSELRLDGVPQHRRHVDAVEARQLLDAGRRGDVDLSEVVADDVDADEHLAALPQLRADRLAALVVAPGHPALPGLAADMPVGARLALRRDSVAGAELGRGACRAQVGQ